jgi:hypothetical protein
MRDERWEMRDERCEMSDDWLKDEECDIMK